MNGKIEPWDTLSIDELKNLVVSLEKQLQRQNDSDFLEFLESLEVFKEDSIITKENYHQYDFFLNIPRDVFSERNLSFLERIGFKISAIAIPKSVFLVAIKKERQVHQ